MLKTGTEIAEMWVLTDFVFLPMLFIRLSMSKQIMEKSVFFWGRKWKQLYWNCLFLLLIHLLESSLLYLQSSCSPWRKFVKKREWEAWFLPFVFTVIELRKFFPCWFLVEEEASGRQDSYSWECEYILVRTKWNIYYILINETSERDERNESNSSMN